MNKELDVEVMVIIAMPHNLQILKSFKMEVLKLDGDGMEQLRVSLACFLLTIVDHDCKA